MFEFMDYLQIIDSKYIVLLSILSVFTISCYFFFKPRKSKNASSCENNPDDEIEYKSILVKQTRLIIFIGALFFFISGILMMFFNYTSSGTYSSKYGQQLNETVDGPSLIMLSMLLLWFGIALR
jgi:hypothetical protein